MSEARIAKEAAVAQIVEKLKSAQSVVVVDYRGFTVAEVTDLRNKCRAAGVEYRVYKNTLVEKAAEELNISGLESHLSGPSAFAFSTTDVVTPAKIVNDFIKARKKGTIKGGIVDGVVSDDKTMLTLAELPPKEVLLARLVGTLNAPITKFVVALNAIKEQKEA